MAAGLSCAAPPPSGGRVLLGHGSGGRLTAELIRQRFLPAFDNPLLRRLEDGAVLTLGSRDVVVSTDAFVVWPLEFPGGCIGDLAINGTVNDLAMMGAVPRYLAASFILEEGLSLETLDRILTAMARSARDAGVTLAAGDTKVVEVGKADGLFITTTGVGELVEGFRPSPSRIRPGDVVLVSGPLGRHGITILGARKELGLEVALESDTMPLHRVVASLREEGGEAIHALRDLTRGGLAGALNEMAEASGTGIILEEGTIPVPEAVTGTCELLGLDPLYVANEGVLAAVVSPKVADRALEAMRGHRAGAQAARVGSVTQANPGFVSLRTRLGGSRIVDLLPGDQLPRIC